jgi:hypothetical protein
VKLRAQLAFDAGAGADGHGYKLSLPASFPFARNPLGDASEGIESLKLFVTTKPASFAFMAQPGIRSTPPAVEQLWRTALGTTTRGEAVEKLAVGGDDWTTVLVSFIVRRPAKVQMPGSSHVSAPATA